MTSSSIWAVRLLHFVNCPRLIFRSYSFGAIRFVSVLVLQDRNNSIKILYQESIFHDVAVLDCLAPKPYDSLTRAAVPSLQWNQSRKITVCSVYVYLYYDLLIDICYLQRRIYLFVYESDWFQYEVAGQKMTNSFLMVLHDFFKTCLCPY